MRKNAFIAIVTFLMITIGAMAQSNSYNMVIEMANGTKINIGPNDVKNIYFNDGQLVISGETIEQIAQANSNKMKWVEEYLESLKVYYNKVSNDLLSIQTLFGGELAQMNENIKLIQNTDNKEQIEKLQNELSNYENAIAVLQAQIKQLSGYNWEIEKMQAQITEYYYAIEALQQDIKALKAINIPSLDGYLKTADVTDYLKSLLGDYYNRYEVDALIKGNISSSLTEREVKMLIEDALKDYAKIGDVGLSRGDVQKLIDDALSYYARKADIPASLTKEDVLKIIKEAIEMPSPGLTQDEVRKLIDDALSRFYDNIRDRYYTKEQIDALLKELQSH